MKILIPAYEPGEKMLDLVSRLQKRTQDEIVIVDDGSGKDFQGRFTSAEQMGCIVLHHSSNLGKGAALKTGLRYIEAHGEEEGVVCADCDGQHTVDDIMKIVEVTKTQGTHIVLGTREFVGKVPWRSQLGNTITRVIFSFATGCKINDTQTGLRGYPAKMFGWLSQIAGNRFEYELKVLLDAQRAGYPICEIPITTVYENNNKSSHFRPVIDSMRVYLPIIKFSGSSILSAALDFVLLLVLQGMTGNLLAAVVGARAASSMFNFICNKYFVFNKGSNKNAHSFFRYYALVVALLGCNYLILSSLVNLIGVPLVAAKLITESILFLASYWIQRKFVFNPLKAKPTLTTMKETAASVNIGTTLRAIMQLVLSRSL